ncbi:MAG: 4'-phosphopantetheinyl transferase superfamily protein [Planctomycetes bacterium]|nr:4'-phosphopantetheinyl transferase superfamily protein [Planctomycetota bacterium]MCP4771026.1 4'-phosphopantetheinyl transferase superfamily protein [Planctomycetota bacterium]MCP4861745.1 4'-phosphopantetheinyl transferase superfamily protein [Planctomycetota bacterium]
MASFDLSGLRQQLLSEVLLEVAPVVDRVHDLLPEEAALVASAVESRRNEFSSARCLARQLLAELGAAEQPLLPNPDRSPIWPQGVIGSLSHGRRYCAAMVAPSANETANNPATVSSGAEPPSSIPRLLGIGVDLEDIRSLHTPLFQELLTERELSLLDPTASQEQQALQVLAAFSIKEAVYKAMWPINNDGLAFHDVEIRFHPELSLGPDLKAAKIVGLDGLTHRLPPRCQLNAYQLTQNQTFLSIVTILQMAEEVN